jgi:predicted transposase/invertase (TIGR01784 family)
MMVDKLKTLEDFEQLSQQKNQKSYFEKIKEKLTDNRIIEVINEAITLLLERINVPEEEIGKIKAHISEGRLEQMFEMLVDYDVQKVKMEGKLEGKMEGKLEGKIEGKLEGKIEVAKNMLAKNFIIDLIVEVTGLSSEEINRIKEEIAGNIQ